jgi:MFS family permease
MAQRTTAIAWASWARLRGFAQAVAPVLFGVLVDRIGEASLIVSSALSIAALGCLMLVTKANQSPPDEFELPLDPSKAAA